LGDVLTSKLRRRPRVNEQHGVSQDSLPFTTVFLLEFQYSFYLFPTLLFFGFFTFWVLHRLSESSTASYFCSQHNLSKSSTIFCFAEMLSLLKWG